MQQKSPELQRATTKLIIEISYALGVSDTARRIKTVMEQSRSDFPTELIELFKDYEGPPESED